MPRGIPKDPNHPRNKKRPTEAGSAPKRRGRPPGSKNVKATKGSVGHVEKEFASHAAKTSKAISTLNAKPTIDVEHKLQIVRDNISVLSHAAGAENALAQQVELLTQLTGEAFASDQEKDVDNDEGSSDFTAPPPVAVVAPLPSFVPPPPFPQ